MKYLRIPLKNLKIEDRVYIAYSNISIKELSSRKLKPYTVKRVDLFPFCDDHNFYRLNTEIDDTGMDFL